MQHGVEPMCKGYGNRVGEKKSDWVAPAVRPPLPVVQPRHSVVAAHASGVVGDHLGWPAIALAGRPPVGRTWYKTGNRSGWSIPGPGTGRVAFCCGVAALIVAV